MKLYKRCKNSGVVFDSYLYASCIIACARAVEFAQARQLHKDATDRGLALTNSVVCAVISMYGRSSELAQAISIFDNAINNPAVKSDIMVWTALASAYGHNGDGKAAIQLLQRMDANGVKPDGVFFTSLLDACSHAGMPQQALMILEQMEKKYEISPSPQHYSCVIDGFGRKGDLEKAKSLTEKLVENEKLVPLMSLLSSSRLHKNLAIAEFAYNELRIMDKLSAPSCILIYLCTIKHPQNFIF